MSATDTVTKKR